MEVPENSNSHFHNPTVVSSSEEEQEEVDQASITNPMHCDDAVILPAPENSRIKRTRPIIQLEDLKHLQTQQLFDCFPIQYRTFPSLLEGGVKEYCMRQGLLKKLENLEIFNLFVQNLNNCETILTTVNTRPVILDQLLNMPQFLNGGLLVNPNHLTSIDIIKGMQLANIPGITQPPTTPAAQAAWNIQQILRMSEDPAHYAFLCISILSDLEYQHQLQISTDLFNQLPIFESQSNTHTYATATATTTNEILLFPLIKVSNDVNIQFAKLIPSQLAIALGVEINGLTLEQQKKWLSDQSTAAQQDKLALNLMVYKIRQQQQQGFVFI